MFRDPHHRQTVFAMYPLMNYDMPPVLSEDSNAPARHEEVICNGGLVGQPNMHDKSFAIQTPQDPRSPPIDQWFSWRFCGGGGGTGGDTPTGTRNMTGTPTEITGSKSIASDGGDTQAAITAQVQTGTGIAPSISGYASSDTGVVFLNALAGYWSKGEGYDRTEVINADQDTLVTTVASTCNTLFWSSILSDPT
ncbi:hypothetical protein K504DRAFT_509683 [Pleomassaria siparia CBS 279.74]|uniref:Uncharacterized protein n=1 Tax=Pleomassaria siparia CBS 279.74 TaxID=1314801 RepID=A0A6G1KQV3_9PLEO|nr:hypothetical protein K504DRAFT_509683 [Pleomassaria siparia CBS 279.74]